MVIHASRSLRCGKANTASGTSHREYCGLHTLFVSRKPATNRKHSCATRGRRCAVRATYPTPIQTATNSSRETALRFDGDSPCRSEEHTSELQSLMRISYAVFCLKKKTQSCRQDRSIHTTETTGHSKTQ